MSGIPTRHILLPGDKICEDDGFIRGHGTASRTGDILSTYLGRVRQFNKLLTVSPCFTFKYMPEIGDVVIGRVTAVSGKKWRINTNSKIETTLALSAINLPGVMQRRKLESDEMDMRQYFDLDDLVLCEVQKVAKGRNAALHTRNDKYRRLEGGLLVEVPLSLLCHAKTRFITVGGMEAVIAANGYVWLSKANGAGSATEAYRMISLAHIAIKSAISSMGRVDVEKILSEITK